MDVERISNELLVRHITPVELVRIGRITAPVLGHFETGKVRQHREPVVSAVQPGWETIDRERRRILWSKPAEPQPRYPKLATKFRNELRSPCAGGNNQVFCLILSAFRGDADPIAVGGPIRDRLLGMNVGALSQRNMAVACDRQFTPQQPALMVKNTIRPLRQLLNLRETNCQRGLVQQFNLCPFTMRQPLARPQLQVTALMKHLLVAVSFEPPPILVRPSDSASYRPPR